MAGTVELTATAGVQAVTGRAATPSGSAPLVARVAGRVEVLQASRLSGPLTAAQEEAPRSGQQTHSAVSISAPPRLAGLGRTSTFSVSGAVRKLDVRYAIIESGE